MSVYTKILELQKCVRGLAPDAKGQTGSATYKYTSGSKLLAVVRPKMDEIGLLLLPDVDSMDVKRIDYTSGEGPKSEMLYTLTFSFTWIDAETGEKYTQKFAASGMNSYEKGLGSALTYAERYFLLKSLHIATDEDDVDAMVRDADIKASITFQDMQQIAQKLANVTSEQGWKDVCNWAESIWTIGSKEWDQIINLKDQIK